MMAWYVVIIMLERFQMKECNSRGVPADPHSRLSKRLNTVEEEFFCRFCEAVGSIVYAMTCTRPDIAFSVGQVAQFCRLGTSQQVPPLKTSPGFANY